MYGEEYLIRNIDIIFDQEDSNFTTDYSFHYVGKSKDENFGERGGTRINNGLSAGDSFSLEWDTYVTLKKLYTKIEMFPSDKEIFIKILKNKISDCEDVFINSGKDYRSHNTASLAFYFLLSIGKYDEIIDSLKILQEKDLDEIDGFFGDILLFIRLEPGKFNEPLLDALFELNVAYEDVNNLYDDFFACVVTWKYLKLKDDLNGVNEEINIDKEKVIEIINKYGFPQDMETYLLEIDNVSRYTDFQIISSGLIGKLRSFFEGLIINIAEKIHDKTHEDYPEFPNDPNIKDMGIKRAYIKKHLKLTDTDNHFINSFVNILNKEGGHALVSEKKYFIMTRNIGIEIAYFLLAKYEDFLETSR